MWGPNAFSAGTKAGFLAWLVTLVVAAATGESVGEASWGVSDAGPIGAATANRKRAALPLSSSVASRIWTPGVALTIAVRVPAAPWEPAAVYRSSSTWPSPSSGRSRRGMLARIGLPPSS